jgi:hypothetical protein
MVTSVAKWLEEVVLEETPPPAIIAFNVGLFESPEGYCAYLSGAERYSEADPDWACDEAFTPAKRYCVLGEMAGREWDDVQRSIVESVRTFLDSPPGAGSFLAKARAVTVGFDDGDLVPVKLA